MTSPREVTSVGGTGAVTFSDVSALGGGTVLDSFLKGKPTEIDTVYVDFETCKCRLHRKVTCGIPNGEGCTAKGHGRLPLLSAMYDSKTSHTLCNAEPATRRNDKKYAERIKDLTVLKAAYLGVPATEDLPLLQCMRTTVEDWGAGYCYMPWILASARFRVGRVSGPEILVVDFLRHLRVAGASSAVGAVVLVVERGVHLVKKKSSGVDTAAGAKLVSELMALVEQHGDGLRIGVAGPGRDLQLFLKHSGVSTVGIAESDMDLLSYTFATMPLTLSGGRLRYKQLALVGDRVLKLLRACACLGTECSMEAIYNEELSSQSDLVLATAAVASTLMDHISVGADVNPSSPRVAGLAVRALFGAVFSATPDWSVGYNACVGLSNALGLSFDEEEQGGAPARSGGQGR